MPQQPRRRKRDHLNTSGAALAERGRLLLAVVEAAVAFRVALASRNADRVRAARAELVEAVDELVGGG